MPRAATAAAMRGARAVARLPVELLLRGVGQGHGDEMLAAALRGAGRAAERGAHLAAAEPRGLGVDVVAAGHARDALAREQHDVQQRRREADQGPRAAAVGELSRRPVGHGGRF